MSWGGNKKQEKISRFQSLELETMTFRFIHKFSLFQFPDFFQLIRPWNPGIPRFGNPEGEIIFGRAIAMPIKALVHGCDIRQTRPIISRLLTFLYLKFFSLPLSLPRPLPSPSSPSLSLSHPAAWFAFQCSNNDMIPFEMSNEIYSKKCLYMFTQPH